MRNFDEFMKIAAAGYDEYLKLKAKAVKDDEVEYSAVKRDEKVLRKLMDKAYYSGNGSVYKSVGNTLSTLGRHPDYNGDGRRIARLYDLRNRDYAEYDKEKRVRELFAKQHPFLSKLRVKSQLKQPTKEIVEPEVPYTGIENSWWADEAKLLLDNNRQRNRAGSKKGARV